MRLGSHGIPRPWTRIPGTLETRTKIAGTVPGKFSLNSERPQFETTWDY